MTLLLGGDHRNSQSWYGVLDDGACLPSLTYLQLFADQGSEYVLGKLLLTTLLRASQRQ